MIPHQLCHRPAFNKLFNGATLRTFESFEFFVTTDAGSVYFNHPSFANALAELSCFSSQKNWKNWIVAWFHRPKWWFACKLVYWRWESNQLVIAAPCVHRLQTRQDKSPNCSAGQVQSSILTLPKPSVVRSSGHARHASCPVKFWYVPALQRLHALLPCRKHEWSPKKFWIKWWETISMFKFMWWKCTKTHTIAKAEA